MYDEAQDALAAEYVLGTLSADEREHAEALLAIDPGFADSIRMWERRLGELNVMVEAVEPPPSVWEKISKEIGYVPAPSVTESSTAIADVPPADVTVVAADQILHQPTVDSLNEDGASTLPPAENLHDSVSNALSAPLERSLVEPEIPPDSRSTLSDSSRLAPDRSLNVVQLNRRVRKWRGIAIAMQAIAALLAIYVIAAQFYPGLLALRGRIAGPQQVAQAPTQTSVPLPARLVGVLQQDPTNPAFLLTVDTQSRTLIVRRVSASPDKSRSYELWLMAKGAAPKSLGVVGADEFTQRSLPGNVDLAMLRSASYAVSLEPAGGSPSGAPTGPVLFTGSVVDSVPTTPRT